MTSIDPKAKSFLTKNSPLEKIITKIFIEKSRDGDERVKLNLAKFFMFQIKPFYKKQNLKISPIIFNMINEAHKNAYWHGGDFKPHYSTTQIFISPTALISKHNDQGNYFKRTKIKQAWENKIKFPEKHKLETNRAGFGLGTGLIYKVADFIYVDTDKGNLYLGTNTNNKNNFHKIR